MSYYETALTFTSQFYFCGLPLRLDAYSYCSFGCRYCFAKQRGGNFNQPRLKVASPRALERWLDLAGRASQPHESILVELLRQRIPIHFGGMTDPFPVFEDELRVSLRLLEVLDAYQYPVVISTKSLMASQPPYLSILRRMKYRIVQFSISSLSEEFTRRTEGNTPSPSERLKAMATLRAAGVPVFCRLQPFFPLWSGDALALIQKLPASGCLHVAVEHLKLPFERNSRPCTNLSASLGIDVWEYYRRVGAKKAGREWILPAEVKEPYLQPLIIAIQQLGMTFGAADNDLQYLSDTLCCCSGIDQVPGFQGFFRHQIGFAIRTSRGSKEIRYDLVAREWAPEGSPNRFLNSNVRENTSDGCAAKVADYIRQKWNSPGTQNSPTSWWGVRPCYKRDTEGNQIYTWS